MQTGNQFLQSKESEANTTESHGVLQNTAPGDFENLMEFFREAELIHLECLPLEIHLYQLFFRVGL